LGYLVGTLIISAIAFKIVALWLTILVYVITIGLGVLMGYYLHDFVIVMTTSIFGGFMMVLSVGSAIGNYPSYMTIK
jgi:hypothetical protein